MEEISSSNYRGSSVILATGRQGNKLYLDYNTNQPIRYELRSKVVEFEEYKDIDGLGKLPFLIRISSKKGVAGVIKITDLNKQISIPRNFFSIPKHLKVITHN
jgi:hypothetical protein